MNLRRRCDVLSCPDLRTEPQDMGLWELDMKARCGDLDKDRALNAGPDRPGGSDGFELYESKGETIGARGLKGPAWSNEGPPAAP